MISHVSSSFAKLLALVLNKVPKSFICTYAHFGPFLKIRGVLCKALKRNWMKCPNLHISHVWQPSTPHGVEGKFPPNVFVLGVAWNLQSCTEMSCLPILYPHGVWVGINFRKIFLASNWMNDQIFTKSHFSNLHPMEWGINLKNNCFSSSWMKCSDLHKKSTPHPMGDGG